MTIRAIAWDVDGTLVDSEPLHHRALLAGTARFGVDLSDLPGEAFRGVHMGDVWKILRPRLPGSLSEAEWLDAINEHYVSHRNELVAIPQAAEMVRAFAAQGLAQVCVSNSARVIVDANLDALRNCSPSISQLPPRATTGYAHSGQFTIEDALIGCLSTYCAYPSSVYSLTVNSATLPCIS